MELTFVTSGTINYVWQEKLPLFNKNGVIVFGNKGLGLVSYKKELSGETEYFGDLARLSKELSSVIICGCDTDTYGVYRHSVAVADSGRLLGVSDISHSIDDSEFSAGGTLRVYDTSKGRIGIIVGEDLFFSQTVSTLSMCDADFIVCVFSKLESFMPQVCLRANAFMNGILIALCSEKRALISDIKGNISFAGTGDIIKTNIKIEKDFHLVSVRKRGLYKDDK